MDDTSAPVRVIIGEPVIGRWQVSATIHAPIRPARIGTTVTEVTTWDREGGLRVERFDAYGNRGLTALRR